MNWPYQPPSFPPDDRPADADSPPARLPEGEVVVAQFVAPAPRVWTVFVAWLIVLAGMIMVSTAIMLEVGDVPFTIPDAKPTRREALAYYRKVVEHWDVLQEVPSSSAHDNGMF